MQGSHDVTYLPSTQVRKIEVADQIRVDGIEAGRAPLLFHYVIDSQSRKLKVFKKDVEFVSEA